MDEAPERMLVSDTRSRTNDVSNIVRMTAVLVVVCLLVSTVAIILAATSLSKEGTTINVGRQGGASASSSEKYVDDMWTFAIGHDGSNIEYIDDTTGTLRGFHVDIVSAVCAQANKNCRLVWDIYGNCWDSEAGQQARGGVGLMSGWYDACTGWFNTYERSITFQFTDDFRKPFDGVFYVKQGNPNGFDPASIGSNQKIGFGDGWSTDEYCLAKNADSISGVPLDPSQIVHYRDKTDISAAVISGEVVAAFVNSHTPLSTDLERIGQPITNCHRGGAGMMSRMHSTLNDWWNPAFDAVRQSGAYRDICAKVDNDHGDRRGFAGDVICLD